MSCGRSSASAGGDHRTDASSNPRSSNSQPQSSSSLKRATVRRGGSDLISMTMTLLEGFAW